MTAIWQNHLPLLAGCEVMRRGDNERSPSCHQRRAQWTPARPRAPGADNTTALSCCGLRQAEPTPGGASLEEIKSYSAYYTLLRCPTSLLFINIPVVLSYSSHCLGLFISLFITDFSASVLSLLPHYYYYCYYCSLRAISCYYYVTTHYAQQQYFTVCGLLCIVNVMYIGFGCWTEQLPSGDK